MRTMNEKTETSASEAGAGQAANEPAEGGRGVIAGCDECHAEGRGNALYLWHGRISCPVRGEISSQRRAEYQPADTRFLVSPCLTHDPCW